MKKLFYLFLSFLTLIFSSQSLANNSKINELKIRADQGNAEAQLDLGMLYCEGRGVKQNYSDAVKYFKLSADQGNVQAQNNLGWMYENGYGVK